MSDPPSPTRKLPYHGPCYVCGPDNPEGLGLDWYYTGDRVHSTFRFTESQQGPRDHVHGGAAAAVLDEAMGAAAWMAGHRVLAANLSVDFRKPVPLGVDVEVQAWLEGVDGRKAFTRSRLVVGGTETVLVEARGLFVSAPDFFGDVPAGWQPGGSDAGQEAVSSEP